MLNYWIRKFVLEVRKEDGQEYPPNSLASLVMGLQRYLPNSLISLIMGLQGHVKLCQR